MKTILYLIRHAQSHPTPKRHHSEWLLSSIGRQQAQRLSDLLIPLGIAKLFSSPFTRCLETVDPFSQKAGIDITVDDDLRERLITKTWVDDFHDIWCKSWEDFSFALSGCETSKSAQCRFVSAVTRISDTRESQVIAISTHGNVMGLFLNWVDRSIGREDAEKLVNPDIVKIARHDGSFSWDRTFHLKGLAGITTEHEDTPIDR